MEESELKSLAEQLRKPTGDNGLEVARFMNEGNKEINLNTISTLQLKKGDHVLEIGMGNGFFIKDLMEYEITHYTGVDFSEDMVRDAEERNKELISQNKVEFLFGQASDLPVPDHTIDKIFTINTIYFWPDPVAVLSESRRALKPGGALTIAVRPEYIMKKLPVTQYGFNLYSEKRLIELFTSQGWLIRMSLEILESEQEVMNERRQLSGLIVSATPE